MARKSAVALAGALLLAGAPAHAQGAPKGFSSGYKACRARAGDNTVQRGLCAHTELVAQDAKLNKAYQEVMRQLGSDHAGRLALQQAEQSWLKERDYRCQVDDHTVDDSCLVEKTAARADELESRVKF